MSVIAKDIAKDADKLHFEPQAGRLLCEARAECGRAIGRAACHHDVDLIQSKDTRRSRHHTPGRETGFEVPARQRPASRISKGGIAAVQFPVRGEFDDPGAFTNRRLEPDRVFARGDQSSPPSQPISTLS